MLCFQVEEEATDKDNKNCSKDGMCSKVRLSLPFYFLSSFCPDVHHVGSCLFLNNNSDSPKENDPVILKVQIFIDHAIVE